MPISLIFISVTGVKPVPIKATSVAKLAFVFSRDSNLHLTKPGSRQSLYSHVKWHIHFSGSVASHMHNL